MLIKNLPNSSICKLGTKCKALDKSTSPESFKRLFAISE